MQKIGFIGAGTVGTALAVCLSQKGYDIAAVSSRSEASARRLAALVTSAQVYADPQALADAADWVLVTTPDGVIGSVVSSVKWRIGQSVVHCSGADSLDVLGPASRAGCEVGAIHPLQTFASIEQAIANLPGSTFSLEAEGRLLDRLKTLVADLGGNAVLLRAGDKVLYHAAAVISCNYVVTLVKLAADLWETFGVPRADAVNALLPLLKGTVNNIEKVGLPNCLTGPIARGDTGTIIKHLAAIRAKAPELLSTYCELGLQTIPISLSKGRIDDSKAVEMNTILVKTLGET